MDEHKDDIIHKDSILSRIWSRNWSWLLAATITAVFMITAMIIIGVAPFGTNSFTLVDSIHQYVPFYSDFQDKLKNGGSFLYTWDVGMGQNFQTLYLYYMACPLNFILYFVKRKHIIAVFSMLVAFKIVFSAGAFSYYLSRRRGKITNNFMILSLGVAYALNNYMCGYYWNVMWLDCIMVFPLIILGFDQLMKRKDPRLYAAALFYSMYCNYYISFIICIFLVLWFLVTSHSSIKGFIQDGLRFAGSSLLAAGMAGFSLLMAYLAIMKTATARTAMPEWSWYQSFFQLLQSQYFLTKPINMNTFDGPANLYAGTLPYILIFIYILSDRIGLGEKLGRTLLVVFFIVSMNQEKLNFIWHGFHNQFGIPNRFSFLYIFTILVMGYEMVIRLRKTNIYLVSAGIFLSAVCLAVIYRFADMTGFISDRSMLLASMGLIILYAVFILMRVVGLMKVKLNTVILGTVLLIEIITNAAFGIGLNGVADGAFYLQYSDEMESAVHTVDKQAEDEGRLFYRSEVISPIMMNENSYNNMRSIGTFCSTVRGDMVSTMAYMGYYTGANEFLYLGSTPVTNDLFGLRYIYVRSGDYYPEAQELKPVFRTDDMVVYENENALPVMYAVNSKVDDRWTYASYHSASVLNHFANYATDVKDDIFQNVTPVLGVAGEGCEVHYSEKSPNVISYNNGIGDRIGITVVFKTDEAGRYFINCRGNYIERITYKLNDLQQASGRYQSQLMDLGELQKGDKVELHIVFSSSYSPDGSVTAYISRLDRDALAEFRGQMTRNAGLVEAFEDGYVSGTVTLDEDQMIMTSIPYDEGWSIAVDGERVEPVKVAGAFIGIQAGEGTHKLEMKYVPPGMVPGLVITAISWLIYLIIFIATRKRVEKISKRQSTN